MATPTLTFGGTTRSTAESTTNWIGLGGLMTPLAVTDFFRQGTASVGSDAKTANRRGVAYTGGTSFDATTNLIGIWVWVASENSVNTFENGGVRVYLSSSTSADTNYEEYSIGGSNVDWVGKGWRFFVIDYNYLSANFAPALSSGTYVPSTTTTVGASCDFTSTLGRADGMAVDIIRNWSNTTPLVEATGGTSSDPITLQGIVDQDGAGGADTHYGAIYQDANGNKLLNAQLTVGDVSGSSNTYLKDTNSEIIIAQDQPVGDDHTGIDIDHDTGTTEIIFGTKVGTGLSSVGADGFTLLKSDKNFEKNVFFTTRGTNINTFGLYGCTTIGIENISLGIEGTALGGTTDTIELVDNQFIRSNQILKNIGVTPTPATQPTAPLLVNNKISFNVDYRASFDIEDQQNMFGYQFQYIQSSGFIETTTNPSSITFDADGFDFNSALNPYLNVTDNDEIWDIINPIWTIEPTKEKQIDFSSTPTVTDQGEVSTVVMKSAVGSQRNLVRRSNGDLYFVWLNSTGGDIEIIKSLDDGVTWSSVIDDSNSPVTGSGIGENTPSIAIDGNDIIHMIWYDGTGTDLVLYTTFDTDKDQWNNGSPASETTVKNVTITSPSLAITVDSNNDAHVVFISGTDAGVYYNNSIDFSTNEVQVDTRTSNSAYCDICIRPSDNIPLICWGGNESGVVAKCTYFEGNAVDATSFTELDLTSYLSSAIPSVIQGVSMCVSDIDDVIIAQNTGNQLIDIIKISGGDATTTPELLKSLGVGVGAISTFIPSISCSNNKIYVVYEDLADDEIKFYESKNYGVGWSEPVAITSATTSDNPTCRANHGLHESNKNKIDIIYRDSADNPQTAILENVGNAGIVNEKYELNMTAKEPSGTLINNARVKIVETNEKDFIITDQYGTETTGEAFSTTQEILCSEFNFTKPTKVTKIRCRIDGNTVSAGTVRAVVITGYTVSQNNGTIQYSSPTINWTDVTNESTYRDYIFEFTSPITLTGNVLIGFESSSITGSSTLAMDDTSPVLDLWRKDTISTGNWSTTSIEGIAMRVFGIEEQTTDELSIESSTGASGETALVEYTTRQFTQNGDGLNVVRHENSDFKSYKYGKLPFVSIVGNISSEQILDAIHLPDIYQIQTTASTARTLGDTTNIVEIQKQTNPASIIKYTSGSGTLTVGATVTGDTSGASGIVVEILEGDSIAGTVLLNSRNSITTFTNGEGLTESGTSSDWTGTYTASTQTNYTWLINADSLTFQELYDYMNAKFDETPLDDLTPSFMDTVAIWGRGEHGLPIQGTATSPNKFKTVRNTTSNQGWAIYGFSGGFGASSQFTSDDGTTFIPTATVTINVTCQSTATGNNISNVKVSIYDDPVSSGDSPIASGLTNGSGVFSTSLALSLPFDIQITARLRGLAPFTVISTIQSGTTVFDVTAPMGTDSAVDRNQ